MSFGIGISFGRLCRLEQQRKEAFDKNQPILEVETDNYIYREYNSFTMCKEVDFPGLKITNKPFSFISKKAIAEIFNSECT